MVWLSITALVFVVAGAGAPALAGEPDPLFTAELETRASTLKARGLPLQLAEWTRQVAHERGISYYELNQVDGGDVARAHRALMGLFELDSGRVTSTSSKLELVGTTSRPRTKRMLELAFGQEAHVELVPATAFIDSVRVRTSIRVGPDEVPVAARVIRFDDVAAIAMYRPWWTNYRPDGDLAPVVVVGGERASAEVTTLVIETVAADDARDAIAKGVASRHGAHFVLDSDGVIYQTTDVLRTMEYSRNAIAIAMATATQSCPRETTDAQRLALTELRRALEARFPALTRR